MLEYFPADNNDTGWWLLITFNENMIVAAELEVQIN
jgi:hypothetical protein